MVVRLSHGKKPDLAQRAIAALQGSYVLSGVAAGLRSAFRLVAPDKIPYVITGSDAGLTVTPAANQPPVWNSPSNATFNLVQGQSLDLRGSPYFTDDGGTQNLTMTLQSGTLGTGLTFNNGVFTAASDAPLTTRGPFVVRADDGIADTVDLTTFTLSGASGTQPFTFAQALKKGDVPTGQSITSSVSDFQADVRTRWPDGSAKVVVLSGRAANGSHTLRRGGTPYSASNVAEPSVAAVVAFTSVTDSGGAAVAGGSFSADIATARANGSGAWSRTTARKVREILGPVMSEFHYFVPTADAHTHVWFYVRAYIGGQVEVETVVENGWLQVASPGRRNYNVTVTIGGTQRYNGTGIQHYHHTRWSRVDWAGGDPGVTCTHDVAYLKSTSVVPNYAVTSLDSAAYTTLPQNGTKHSAMTRALAEQPTPFSLANFDSSMGSGGDADAYGIVPGWGATYLIEGDQRALWSCIATARASGRFCLHYRDEADGRPFRGSAYPSLGINYSASTAGISELSGNWSQGLPTPTGGAPSTLWYYTHSPAAAFMGALLTGRWQFMEEMQFVVGTAELQTGLVYNGYRLIGWWPQLREQGWKFRDRIQAEAVVPSELRGVAITGADLNQRTEAVGRVEKQVDYEYDLYVSGSLSNRPSSARGNAFGLPWQDTDFDFTGGPVDDGEHAYGGLQNGIYCTSRLYGFDADPNLSSGAQTKLRGLAEFHAKFPVGMMGAQPNGATWNWRVMSFTALGFGTPGITSGDLPATTYRASFDANWTRITTGGSPYVWEDGTFPVPNDNYLRTIQYNENTGNPRLRLNVRTTFPTNTDFIMMCWAINYAHKIADRATISGADTAISRLLGSDTWVNGVANLMRTRPDFAVKTDRA